MSDIPEGFIAHDVERLILAPARRIDAMRGHAVQDMVEQQANTIATLRAKLDLDKAVEGLEAIATSENKSANSFRIWAKQRTQSILKELRP